MLSPQNKQVSKKTGFLSLLLVFLLAIALGIANRQAVIDWWHLRQYDVPVSIASLASQDMLTDHGRRIFYVSRPAIVQKPDFHKSCPTTTAEQTIVLGCYTSLNSKIFLLDVTDERLNGVEQVTAAHEMLHAAYARLGDKERTKIDGLLTDYYKNQLRDERLIKTIEAYKKSEPNDVVNEMHSIFGTEIANLPPALEEYYDNYFQNRTVVTDFAVRYQAEFTKRENAVDSYDFQLQALKAKSDTLENELRSQQATITSQQQNLLALKSTNISAYNAGVPGFNRLVDTYNANVRELRSLIEQYNQLVATRNAIALEENELVKSLSGDITTINQ